MNKTCILFSVLVGGVEFPLAAFQHEIGPAAPL